MALVHVTFSANESCKENHHQNQDFSKGIDENAFEANSNSVDCRKLKYGPSTRCLCACKENVERRKDCHCGCGRTRSKGDDSYDVEVIADTHTDSCERHPAVNRPRTYSGCRTMHDKGINVYVMPEKMPELFLDSYSCSAKQNIKWTSDSDDKCCQTCPDDPTLPLEDNNEASYRERNAGVKRTRDESPGSFDSEGVPATDKVRDVAHNAMTNFQADHSNRDVHIQETNANGCHHNSVSNVFHNVEEQLEKFHDSHDGVKYKRSKTLNSNSSVLQPTNTTECTAVPLSRRSDKLQSTDHDDVQQKQNTHKDVQIVRDAVLKSKCTQDRWNSGELHPSLRKSLFPFVPPFIKFSSYEKKVDSLPIHVHKLLRWKLTIITPLVVRKIVSNSGFRLLKKSTFWGGTWGKHTKSIGFKTLFDYQKMNHFPGTFQIGRKDRLWKSLQKLMFKHGKHKFDLMPTTYVLPQDKRMLKLAWKKMDEKEPWIIKPPASARGTGIKVVHKWNQIPDNTPLIVQKYISKPYLINDTKFDLRLYVLVTSVNPLRIYLYDNGLVRFASVKYSTELNTLSDRYMHLTNYSINKLSSKYKQNEDATACQGHKWTLKTLWTYMKNELNIDVTETWNKLIDLIIKTIISGENPISNMIDANLGSRYNSYELFGVDVLFDVDLKPWLLEVNISPSLHSASPLDLAVKAPLVRDLMNIVGFQIPCSKKFTEEELCADMGNVADNRLCFDSRLYTRSLSYSEKQKHYRFTKKPRSQYLNTILEDLTPDDVRHLIQYEDELTQLGSFQKIFPTVNSHEYLQYLDNPKYYNLLFDAWETKYHKNRQDGIRLLTDKCEEGMHLKISKEIHGSSRICETLPKCQQQESQNDILAEDIVYPKNSYLPIKVKTASYLVKPRHLLRRPLVPSKMYPLRPRKVK